MADTKKVKTPPTLEEVVALFEKNTTEGRLEPLVMPPAGVPINTLRSQMGLLITLVKDMMKKIDETHKVHVESINDLVRKQESLEFQIREVEQSIELLKDITVQIVEKTGIEEK